MDSRKTEIFKYAVFFLLVVSSCVRYIRYLILDLFDAPFIMFDEELILDSGIRGFDSSGFNFLSRLSYVLKKIHILGSIENLFYNLIIVLKLK